MSFLELDRAKLHRVESNAGGSKLSFVRTTSAEILEPRATDPLICR